MTSENGTMYMPVAPAYGAPNAGGFGLDGLGGGWGLLILLIVLFGGRGFGNWGGNSGNSGEGNMLPWLLMNNTSNAGNTTNEVQRGFDQAAIIGGINGLQNSVTAGFAGVANGFAQAEIANNARQMADMQQMFGVQSTLQQCCCQQSANTADLKYTVATEACADRAAITSALRDVLEANNASTQRILDVMCQDKIDAKNERIAELQQQLYMKDLAASQLAQTATIQAGQRTLANEIEQYVNPTPRPAWVVANPYCCQANYNGCGCGN